MLGYDNVLCDLYSCPRAKICQRHILYQQAKKDKFPQVTTFLWECFPSNCEYFVEQSPNKGNINQLNSNNG